jgi:putative ATP-binding cassette transporter
VNALLEATPALTRMQVALERIQALGLAAQEPSAPSQDLPPEPLRRLTLRGVMHRHHHEDDPQAFALGPISLELRPFELVFLVGGNGSGKTTLAKLLVGLYEPHAGEVYYNETLVGDAQREVYRQSFSAVFSDFHVFQSLLGQDEWQLDTRARELLEALDLDHKLTIERGVLSTTALSSGQQKRLALLAAWLEDRPVYVFDEWAADQDPAYKEVFYGRVLPALKARGKAVLVITHDDRFFHLADRCLKLESGVLVEQPEARLPVRSPRADAPAATGVATGER